MGRAVRFDDRSSAAKADHRLDVPGVLHARTRPSAHGGVMDPEAHSIGLDDDAGAHTITPLDCRRIRHSAHDHFQAPIIGLERTRLCSRRTLSLAPRVDRHHDRGNGT